MLAATGAIYDRHLPIFFQELLCAVDARYDVRLSGVGGDVLTIGTY